MADENRRKFGYFVYFGEAPDGWVERCNTLFDQVAGLDGAKSSSCRVTLTECADSLRSSIDAWLLRHLRQLEGQSGDPGLASTSDPR